MQIRPRGLFEYFEILWRRKKLIFFVMLAMLIATYVVIRRIPFLYESRALIQVTNLQQMGDGMPEPGMKFTSVMQQLRSRGNLARVVKEHHLYPMVRDRDFARALLNKGIVTDVKNRDVAPDGPESISIAFRHTEKETAQRVVTDLMGLFVGANKEMKERAVTELNKVNIEITEVEGRLREIGTESDLASLRNMATNRMATEAIATRSQRMTVESAIETLTDRQIIIDNQIGEVKKQIADQEKIISDAAARGSLGNAAYGALLVRKADLDAQLKIYLTQYTEKNPKVISVKEQLSEINKQMSRMSGGASEGAIALNTPEMAEMRKLRQELSRLETEKEINQRDIRRKSETMDRLPVDSSAAGSLGLLLTPDTGTRANRAEYDRLATRFTRLVDQQYRLKRVAGLTGVEEPLFDVVDQANLPNMPVAPNLFMLNMLALGMSVGVALLIAIIAELPRIFVLNDERDIEYYLGAPVLALIPETVTPMEYGRGRRIKILRGVLAVLLMVVTIPAIVFIIDSTKIFQILGNR